MSSSIDVVAPAIAAPRDPIAAVTHRDPYPYYARLVAEAPLYRDEALGMWVASGAEAVDAVLTSRLCRVRPLTEPVPKTLIGSPAGEIFRHLVRMNDGERHCPFKQAVAATLGAIDPATVAAVSARWAAGLAFAVAPDSDPNHLTDFAFALPAYVIASLLGAPDDAVPDVARLVGELGRGFAPSGTPDQIAAAGSAAGRLLDLFRDDLRHGERSDTLLAALAAQARRFGRDDEVVVFANAVGFLTQSYEATAGLIGNALLTLATLPDVHKRLRANPTILGELLAEVLRYDSPVQNTRRYVSEDGVVAGQALKEGETVLVVLAAANRDPRANADPHTFDETRTGRRTFTFGAGLHACPGALLATTIAAAGVTALLERGLDPAYLDPHPAYRQSGNVRVPHFGSLA
jgi:cytochrome P450